MDFRLASTRIFYRIGKIFMIKKKFMCKMSGIAKKKETRKSDSFEPKRIRSKVQAFQTFLLLLIINVFSLFQY